MASASQGELFTQPGRPAALGPSPTVHAWTGHQTWLPSKTCHLQALSLASQKAVCSHTHPHPLPQGPPGFPRTTERRILEQNRTPGKGEGGHRQWFREAWVSTGWTGRVFLPGAVSHLGLVAKQGPLRPGPTGSAA